MEINPTTFLPAKIADISTIITFVLPFISLGAAVAFLGMLIYAAFTWMTAADKPENITKAWKIASFAFLGLFIVIISFVAVKLLGLVLGTGTTAPI
jgi:hypothetical protein